MARWGQNLSWGCCSESWGRRPGAGAPLDSGAGQRKPAVERAALGPRAPCGRSATKGSGFLSMAFPLGRLRREARGLSRGQG